LFGVRKESGVKTYEVLAKGDLAFSKELKEVALRGFNCSERIVIEGHAISV